LLLLLFLHGIALFVCFFFICLEQIAALYVCFLIAEMKKILNAGFIWKEKDGDSLGGFAWIAGFF